MEVGSAEVSVAENGGAKVVAAEVSVTEVNHSIRMCLSPLVPNPPTLL